MSGKSGGKVGISGGAWFPLDLLGQPVPANRGAKGRPQHAATPENLRIAIGLYALRKSDADVAAALGVSIPTLKTHYFSSPELQQMRRAARMLVEGKLIGKLIERAEDGDVQSIKLLMQRIDKAHLIPDVRQPKKPKLGKKEQAIAGAKTLPADSDWGELVNPVRH